VTREFLIIDLGEGAEAILSRNELIPGEVFRIGDRLRAVLQEEERENRGPQLALSRRCPEMVGELFKLEVPEISEQVIEIKAIARDPGSRTKIAVKTNDNRIDPVGACVGMRGSRVQAVSNELGNERLDIVIWDDDPAQLLINSMGPVEITSIVLDETKGSMDVAVTQDTLAQAIGKSGQNVRLSSQITGWKLNVIDQEVADQQNQEKSESISNILIDKLDVDEDLANTLISNGYNTLESISSSEIEELSRIEGFDDDISGLLINRAKEVLITMAMEVSTDDGESGDLMSVEGMEMTLALELTQKGINDREELAEQSIEELTSIIEISEEDAGDLIMRARAHWFED
jgi:N utilization substance protein A